MDLRNMVRCMGVALLVGFTQPADAQDVRQLLKAFGDAVKEAQGNAAQGSGQIGGPGGVQSTPRGGATRGARPGKDQPLEIRPGESIDTAENLERVVAEVRRKLRFDPGYRKPEDWCESELWAAKVQNLNNMGGSGYAELRGKCAATLIGDETARNAAVADAEQRRRQIEKDTNAAARAHADDFEARRVQLESDLIAKKRAPVNCAQWVLSNGLSAQTLRGNAVSEVALRAPTGLGRFTAQVEQIDGETLLVRTPSDQHAIILIPKSAQLYDDNRLRVQSKADVVGTQSGTRVLQRANGTSVKVAVVTAACLGEGPSVLDLMPQ